MSTKAEENERNNSYSQSRTSVESIVRSPKSQPVAMSAERVRIGMLRISKTLYEFVNREVVPGTDVNPMTFWNGVQSILRDFSPENQALLRKRDDLQTKIDQWHRTHQGSSFNMEKYKSFLYDIGYLTRRTSDDRFQITTKNADDEIALRAGPQLVVPLMNARFTLNAANARWGSLYDALYGTDAIPETDGCERVGKYNKKRGDKVIAFCRQFLDQTVPLTNNASHSNAKAYRIVNGELQVRFV